MWSDLRRRYREAIANYSSGLRRKSSGNSGIVVVGASGKTGEQDYGGTEVTEDTEGESGMNAISCLPWKEAPIEEWRALLQGLASRDMTTARRAALLRLVWQESFLSREGLTARVEGLLGRGCFGKDDRATFFRDMRAVRNFLAQEGHRLLYSRRPGTEGYYVEGRPHLDEQLQRLIAGAVAEVDARQIAIYQRLSPVQRFQQGCSLIEGAERITAFQVQRRHPHLSEMEAYRWVRAEQKWEIL